MKPLSKEQLRDLIKDKWGTISRFILESDLPVKKVRSSLHRDIPSAVAYRKIIQKVAEEGTPTALESVDVTPELAEKIRVAVYTQFRSASDFCDQHPEFNTCFVSNVINKRRKKRDARVKRLIETLKID